MDAGAHPGGGGRVKGLAITSPRRCGFPSCSAADGEATMKCAACGAVWYCSRAHQRGHWKAHKVECRGGKAKGRAIGAGAAGGAGTVAAVEGKDAGDGGAGDPGKPRAMEGPIPNVVGMQSKANANCMQAFLEGNVVSLGGSQPALRTTHVGTGKPYAPMGITVNGYAELHEAVGLKQYQLLARLLETRDPNHREAALGRSSLCVAANLGDLFSMRMLVDAGADPLLRSNDGSTTIHEATGINVTSAARAREQGQPLAIEFLVKQCGVPVDCAVPGGRRSLHFAVEAGHVAVARMLLSLGADPNSKTLDHHNPMSLCAARKGDAGVVVSCVGGPIKDDDSMEMAVLLVSKGAKGICRRSKALEKRAGKAIAAKKKEVAARASIFQDTVE